MNKQIVVLVGPAASGKTTEAQQYLKEGFVRISRDDQGKQGHLLLFKEALDEGQNIIIDKMDFEKKQREQFLKPARDLGYKTKIIVLHESFETCMNRALARIENESHPTVRTQEDASRAINCFFSKYERVEDSEADEVVRKWPEGPKEPAIICDLDGTLCNIDHRLHHVRDGKKNWKAFFEEMKNDKVNDWCLDIINKFYSDNRIVFCSGRPDSYREITSNWINENCIFTPGSNSYSLFMRNRSDHRRDDIAKENILDFEILTRYTPKFVIDDRKNVVEMWRKRGLVCLQCAEGNF